MPNKIIDRTLKVILYLIVGNMIYFFSKLLYFFVPGVDVYGGPNIYLFIIGNVLAIFGMYKIAKLARPFDQLYLYVGIALYTLFTLFMTSLTPDIAWYFYALLVVIGFVSIAFIHRLNKRRTA